MRVKEAELNAAKVQAEQKQAEIQRRCADSMKAKIAAYEAQHRGELLRREEQSKQAKKQLKRIRALTGGLVTTDTSASESDLVSAVEEERRAEPLGDARGGVMAAVRQHEAKAAAAGGRVSRAHRVSLEALRSRSLSPYSLSVY
jgi:hypothetical protein